jgi:putative addiction module component (TIGR02574 family)
MGTAILHAIGPNRVSHVSGSHRPSQRVTGREFRRMHEFQWWDSCHAVTYAPFQNRAVSVLAVQESRCRLGSVSRSMKKLGIDRLNVEQPLALIEEIWESIDADESAAVQLTDAHRAELRARLAEDEAHPDDVVSWEDIERLAPPPGGSS